MWQLSTLTKALFHFDGSDDVRALCILFCLCDPVTTEPQLSQVAAGAQNLARCPGLSCTTFGSVGAVTHPSVCNWGWCGDEGEPRVSLGKSSLLLSVWSSEGWRDGGKGREGVERDGRR